MGIILGYLLGVKFGEWRAAEVNLFLNAFEERYTSYYGRWGIAIGGVAGLLLGITWIRGDVQVENEKKIH